jgi:hypothetical protein
MLVIAHATVDAIASAVACSSVNEVEGGTSFGGGVMPGMVVGSTFGIPDNESSEPHATANAKIPAVSAFILGGYPVCTLDQALAQQRLLVLNARLDGQRTRAHSAVHSLHVPQHSTFRTERPLLLVRESWSL